MSVMAIYRPPFDLTPRAVDMPDRLTLAEMVAAMPGLPEGFAERGVVMVAGQSVPRGAWHITRPRPRLKSGARTEVTLAMPLAGGDDGGKSILAAIASIALIAATGAIAGGALTKIGFGAAFAKGSIGAYLAAGVVSIAGQAVISALSPPPLGPDGQKASREESGPASLGGNAAEPNGPLPRTAGARKLFPPFVAEPFTYFDGEDEVVEAIVGLAGPHQITDVRVDGAPIATVQGIDYQVREGRPGDARISLIERMARTEAIGQPLSKHTVQDGNHRTLESQSGALTDALPQPRVMSTREAPDEVQLQIAFQGGLHKSASSSTQMRVPFRLRIRAEGEVDWVLLPELHYQAASVSTRRATIRLIWADSPSTTPAAASDGGWVEARTTSPGQTASPSSDDREAHGAFHDGSGDEWMDADNLGTTGVQNVELDRFEAAIYLDVATFPKARYEVEIQRGVPFRNGNYTASNYRYSGSVWDLFGYRISGGSNLIAQSREEVADEAYLVRFVSIWNEHPAPTDDLALIAVRARARAIDALSCVAEGLVPDWDGSAWTGLVATDNPAPHLRDIFAGALNRRPVPAAVIDDAGLVAWRTACTAAGYTVRALFEGQSVEQAASLVASCGYGRPAMADLWGVVRDYDRSAESPVQVFTPRNSRGFSMTKALPLRPDGFLVTFRDAARDYEARQITVPASAAGGVLEQVTYEGFVEEAKVRARAQYDLDATRLRGAEYALSAPAEAIVCRKGSLVGVEHDVLMRSTGSARVLDWVENGAGEVTEIELDAEVPLVNEPDMHAVSDMHAVVNMHDVGRTSAVALRLADGSTATATLSDASGRSATLTLATPAALSGLTPEVLATVGPAGAQFRRLLVTAIRPRRDLEFDLTFFDEAPELHA